MPLITALSVQRARGECCWAALSSSGVSAKTHASLISIALVHLDGPCSHCSSHITHTRPPHPALPRPPRRQRIEFVWGGCQLFRLAEMQADSRGVMQVGAGGVAGEGQPVLLAAGSKAGGVQLLL